MELGKVVMAPSRQKWQVFISFRGEDARPLATQLHDHLYNKGIRAFIDDKGLNRGEVIHPALLEAIEESAASIVLLSENYANSHWCLDELASVCELHLYRRLVLPVFYLVDPSHVRKQLGPFEKDFKRYEADPKWSGEVNKWKSAMEKLSHISGYRTLHSDGDNKLIEDNKLISALVKDVLAALSNTPMNVAQYTVGLDSRMEHLINLLDVKSSSNIHFLGLQGIGGIGKTTLAKALYNKLVGFFPLHKFVSNVRDVFTQPYILETLQKELIMLHNNQVLIVLDDVDNFNQLNALAGKKEWFSEGSRIIITTRNTDVLPKPLVDLTYDVPLLDHSEALQLLSYCALRRNKPTNELMNICNEIVDLTGKLPLALEVFGSFLYDKPTVEQWEAGLETLRKNHSKDIHDILKISYDALDEKNQCVFLDIACLFIQMEMGREEAVDILDGCGFAGEGAIRELITKSLVKIVDGSLWMHDQIRDMGRQIVQEGNFLNSGLCSRLWDRDEINNVLKNQKGTGSIQGMVLDYEKMDIKDPGGEAKGKHKTGKIPVLLQTKEFKSMTNLRLLQINCVNLEGKFKFLPAELKWLQWKHCPIKSIPSDFRPKQLAVLDLSESGIRKIWGSGTNKVAMKLMVLNLFGCYNLVEIPDLSPHKALKKIVLERCEKLVKLHESIGGIDTLLQLNLRGCENLVQFPSNVSGLKNLESLILSSCSKLEKLPDSIGDVTNLKELLLDGTAIKSLPQTIFRLWKLDTLDLSRCNFLKKLPSCIGKLVSLKQLYLDRLILEELPYSIGFLKNLEILSVMYCKFLTAIPDSVGQLESLRHFFIGNNGIKELPCSIGSLSLMKTLSTGNCSCLNTLPESINGLASLVELKLGGKSITYLPNQIGDLKMLKNLEIWECTSLITLPKRIGELSSLTVLNIFKGGISELPESISGLDSLVELRLNECSQLQKLPESIGKMKSLTRLFMEQTAVIELPESFGELSSLMVLKMLKHPLFRKPKNTATINATEKPVVFKSSFTKLASLEELNARSWGMSCQIPDDFEKLTCLEILDLTNNKFCSLPSSLSGLSILKSLQLSDCWELKSLPPLPSSLHNVNLANCFALEIISDLSNLENLHELNLANCEKVLDIPGLECLKSLRRLYMVCCKASSLAIKRRLSKVALKNMYNLSMPGAEIPDWFSQSKVKILVHKFRKIKEMIIGVVVSLDLGIPDDSRYNSPVVVGIVAKILANDNHVFTTSLYLSGVPRNNEAQVHFCRYSSHTPLVTQLKDGYKVEVSCQDESKGVQLKKAGIHVIYENDDDYIGDEESMDESLLSVSERLRKFFSSLTSPT